MFNPRSLVFKHSAEIIRDILSEGTPLPLEQYLEHLYETNPNIFIEPKKRKYKAFESPDLFQSQESGTGTGTGSRSTPSPSQLSKKSRIGILAPESSQYNSKSQEQGYSTKSEVAEIKGIFKSENDTNSKSLDLNENAQQSEFNSQSQFKSKPLLSQLQSDDLSQSQNNFGSNSEVLSQVEPVFQESQFNSQFSSKSQVSISNAQRLVSTMSPIPTILNTSNEPSSQISMTSTPRVTKPDLEMVTPIGKGCKTNVLISKTFTVSLSESASPGKIISDRSGVSQTKDSLTSTPRLSLGTSPESKTTTDIHSLGDSSSYAIPLYAPRRGPIIESSQTSPKIPFTPPRDTQMTISTVVSLTPISQELNHYEVEDSQPGYPCSSQEFGWRGEEEKENV